MMFLLDTNVLSEIRKAGSGRIDRNVARWLSGVDASQLVVSVISLMELEKGVLRMERRDSAQGAMLRTWVDQFVYPEFMHRALPMDAAVALQCAKLHVPDPRSDWDALLAATALVHGMTLVTRNIRDFERMEVSLLNPWDPVTRSPMHKKRML